MPTDDQAPRPSRPFPTLPIVTVDPPAPRKSQAEKYGTLYYLGIVGLVVSVALVARFGYEVWSLRDVWRNVYVLHAENKGEAERIAAAYALSRDARLDDQQRWEIALRKPLPPVARYLLAESIPPAYVRIDSGLFARTVAQSEGWPGWLRGLGARAMAEAAADGVAFPPEELDRLAAGPDPFVVAWVEFIRAVSGEGDHLAAAARLRATASGGGPAARFAAELAPAIEAGALERSERLAAATTRFRLDDPEAALAWRGWILRDGRVDPATP